MKHMWKKQSTIFNTNTFSYYPTNCHCSSLYFEQSTVWLLSYC